MRVLAISGSLRRGSYNTRLLRAAAELVPSPAKLELFAGLGDVPPARLELFEGLADVPPYNEDDDVEPAPWSVRRLRQAIARADAILIATPEYNSSIPGQLKNAVDWASRPFPDNALRGKPVAVIGASTSMFGAVWAQAELRKVLGAAGARVVDRELPVPNADRAFDERGRLADDELRHRLEEVLAALIEEASERYAVAA